MPLAWLTLIHNQLVDWPLLRTLKLQCVHKKRKPNMFKRPNKGLLSWKIEFPQLQRFCSLCDFSWGCGWTKNRGTRWAKKWYIMTLKVRHFMTQISVQGGTKIMEHIFAGDERSEETTLYSGKNQMWVDQSVRTPTKIVIKRVSEEVRTLWSTHSGRNHM